MTAQLLSLAMFIQALEIFWLTRKASFFEIWSDQNLSNEKWLISQKALKIVSLVQIVAACAGMVSPQVSFFIILFFTHLLICMRFRGIFNGGSDMMTFVVLTGVIISLFGSDIGMVYIAVHTIYSYFKAGLAKVIHKEWRNGTALSAFFETSLFVDIRSMKANKILNWIVIIFELGIILLPFFPQLLWFYFAGAMIFHLINYYYFGLNRFFWIWLSAWPAVFYSVKLFSRI